MEYKIAIIKDNGTVSADLRDHARGLFQEFDISNVIGDFISIRTTKQNNEGHRKPSYDLASHVFSGTFDSPLGEQEEFWIESRYEDVNASFKFLKKAIIIINDDQLTFLKKQIAFQELLNTVNTGMICHITMRDSEEDGAIGYNKPSSNYAQLKTQDTWFDYSCRSVLDMVASIMHYYMMNGYKLIPCRHCGRYFATTTLKQEYCHRFSPYQNEFSQKDSKPELCESTVRRELQYLRQKKNRLLNRIGQSPRGQTLRKGYYLTLADKCTEWMEIVKHYPTLENLKTFNSFLDETTQKKEWER